jgi:hypothetical protein
MVDYAFLARGKLFVCLGGDEPREIESPFAGSVASRTQQIQRRNAWKRSGRGARFLFGVEDVPDEALDGLPEARPVHFAGLSRGRYPAEIVYALSTGALSGLFAFAGGEEARLYHGADFRLAEPAVSSDGERIACTVTDKAQSHLAIVRGDGSLVQQVTEGDAAERAPSWVPGKRRVVFESSAYGYDEGGRIVDMAPAVVQELDLDAGTITTVAKDDGADCTSPRVAPDGTLFYVKRARAPRASVSIVRVVADAFLFPFRLIRALLSFLNIWSIRWSGKPLVSPGGARQARADLRRRIVAGNVMNADARAEEEAEKEREKVRLGWQLVARAPSGEERVVTKRVLAFDVFDDGRVIATSGKSLVLVGKDGKETKLRDEEGVTDVVALPPQPRE